MTLAEQLARHTVESDLFEQMDGGRIRCLACGHRCPIAPGHVGVCKVRFNRDGNLFAPRGYVNGIHCDPIEKKPFYHALPGSGALSFGMLGCNLHCGYCQNWVSSQAIRDPSATGEFRETSAASIVEMARRAGAASVVSTYNEPLITAEWAVEVFREARGAGMVTGFVSNGNATPEVLNYLRPWLDLFKVDLKSFKDRHYRDLGGRLQPVLDSIERIHRMGFWLEVVTLVVPGFNDSKAELGAIAGFLAAISREIPWHVTAFHPDYKMNAPPRTPASTLFEAVRAGREAGLRYVYAGNLAGQGGENTHCPECGLMLIERFGFQVIRNRMDGGACPSCLTRIPGFWSTGGKEVSA